MICKDRVSSCLLDRERACEGEKETDQQENIIRDGR